MTEAFGKGDRFGDFEILGQAGEGGMGVVYRAQQISLGRPVALKLISSEVASAPDFRTRFERESRLAAAIDHPHVVPIYAAGEHDDTPYIAMQWIDGASLQSKLGKRPMSVDRAVVIVSQIAGALDAAHSAGLVHRDVKPANIMVRSLGGEDHAYLADFGLAKQRESEGSALTRTGLFVGTPGYTAPELVKGEEGDGRADLYALGCVLYECLTGERPFVRSNEAAMMWAHVSDPRPRVTEANPKLDERFDEVVEKAIATDPDERYRSGADLAAAANAAARGGELPGASPTKIAERAKPTKAAATGRLTRTAATAVAGARERIGTVPAILGAVLVALVVAAGVYAATGGFSGSSSEDTGSGNSADVALTEVLGAEEEPASDPVPDRAQLNAVLADYETAYSNQDLSLLGSLFTPDVTRHGLRRGGCSETAGRREVLDTYAEQFAAGTGTYRLSGRTADAFQIAGDTASTDLAYTIEPGSSGRIGFDFQRDGSGWLISRVDASC